MKSIERSDFMKKEIVKVASLAGIVGFCYYQNKKIKVDKFKYCNKQIPKGFNGKKIMLLSDLHNCNFGFNQSYLLKKIKAYQPDYLFISGDLINYNSSFAQLKPVFDLIEALNDLEIYFVLGNHELNNPQHELLIHYLTSKKVKVLANEVCELKRGHDVIKIAGIKDYIYYHHDKQAYDLMVKQLAKTCGNDFSILLAHRPEFFSMYAQANFNLVFSGHAHGGAMQYRKKHGIFAPNQGFFPKYCDGLYKLDSSVMFVSRGLGNCSCPQRINAYPHLIGVSLYSE